MNCNYDYNNNNKLYSLKLAKHICIEKENLKKIFIIRRSQFKMCIIIYTYVRFDLVTLAGSNCRISLIAYHISYL